jgi:hypothetical protein
MQKMPKLMKLVEVQVHPLSTLKNPLTTMGMAGSCCQPLVRHSQAAKRGIIGQSFQLSALIRDPVVRARARDRSLGGGELRQSREGGGDTVGL